MVSLKKLHITRRTANRGIRSPLSCRTCRSLIVLFNHFLCERRVILITSNYSVLKKLPSLFYRDNRNQGRIQDFFRRWFTCLLLSSNTNKPHSFFFFFFFCRIPVVLENGRSSHTRSAPGSGLVNFVPESRLPFVEMSSIYRKTAVKA